jgi:hypothetical protein
VCIADVVRATGIFFKYDIEPMSLTIRERTTTLLQFLVRLAGIVGGILGQSAGFLCRFVQTDAERLSQVCSDFGFRTMDFMYRELVGESKAPTLLLTSPRPKTPTTGGRAFTSASGRLG